MARPQVSIRLATDGKERVERDFVDIANAGGAQAERLRDKWERETAQFEKLGERLAKTSERLAAVSATPTQIRINNAVGINDGQANAARASAAAIAAELDHAEREAKQLLAALDPLFGAQQRYANNVRILAQAKGAGIIDEQRYVLLLAAEERALEQATVAQARHASVTGATRAGMQQLSFQVGDVAQQIALGTAASTIFIQQSGQVVQALQVMSGETNAFLKFLGGPWGIALSTAAVVAIPLITKLMEAKDETGKLVDKMREQARQAEANDRANAIWERSLDGLIAKSRELNKVQKELIETDRQRMQQQLATLKGDLANAESQRVSLNSQLQDARKAFQERADRYNVDPKDFIRRSLENPEFDLYGLKPLYAELARLTGEYNKAQLAANSFYSLVRGQEVLIARDRAETLGDPLKGIREHYEDLKRTAEATIRDVDKLTARLAELNKQEAAAIKAAQKDARTSASTAGGTAIFDAQIGSYYDTANKYRGRSETTDRGVLEAFFREANLQLDPEKTAWCAAFVNAVLATNGVRGTGSLAARSFLNFGKDDTKSPQRGDIVVVKSGGSPSGTHVGFLESVDAKGNVRVLGGNTADKVGTGVYSKSDVLAIRRPPTPAESEKATADAAAKALRQQNDFEEAKARLNEAYLRAMGEMVTGAEAQADAARRQVKADHDSEALKIQNALEEGKYGEATSELAKARAAELQAANDNVQELRLAAQRRAEANRVAEEADRTAAQEAQLAIERLQFADEIAVGSRNHRDLQLQIIDLVYEEKRRHLEYLKAQADLIGNTEEAARLQAEINALPEQQARDEYRARVGTQSPAESYFAELDKTSKNLDDTFEGIAVDGLKSLNDGLVDAIMNSKSLGEVFHNVAKQILADLIRVAIQMLIIKPLMQALGLGTGGGGGGSPGGNATGTEYFGGGLTWVGENGRELVSLPRGSKISPAAESRRIAAAANDRGPMVSVTNVNDFRGADPQAVAAIQSRLDQMEADLPNRVVIAYQDARARFVIR